MEGFLKTGKLGAPSSSSKKRKPTQKKKESTCTPWVEKYRPRTINDVVEQRDAVQMLQNCVSKNGSLPNLLFYGPPGTGKTSTILAASKELFGDMYRDRILELNASDQRGIQVVRDKVKHFAQFTASSVRPDGSRCPGFKIVILDEADSMTNAAQAALRRTMEVYTKTTRFCLICNYVSRIIYPLASRCAKFRFRALSEPLVMERLKLISNEEGVICDDSTLRSLVKTSGGDLRQAITCLQSCSRLKGKHVPITHDDILEVTGVIPDSWVMGMLKICRTNNYDKLVKFISDLELEAYSSSQLLSQLNDIIVKSTDLTCQQKATICAKLGLCSWRVQDGASDYIELLDLGCTIMGVYQK